VSESLLTAKEAAAYLRVHVNTVKRLVKAGELRHYRLGRGDLRFRREDIDDWLSTKRKEANP
jgi:excisionase family DNA binding protein